MALTPCYMSNWSQFYNTRVNSTRYELYFEDKYKPMLNILRSYTSVCEEGIGIGSISKSLIKNNISCCGIDNCEDMLMLCRFNNPWIDVKLDDIFTHVNTSVDVCCTHGVLEHFSDEDIYKILNKYKQNNIYNIHYVPLNGYAKPSFGDERLLPADYWIRAFKPDAHYAFNQGKDLLLMFG